VTTSPFIVVISIASLAIATSCSAPEPAVESGGSRDSAGVTIVDNSIAHLDKIEVTEVLSPAIRVGIVDGDARYRFFKVRGVASLSDGTITVLNGGEHEVRFYDRAGRFITAVGRKGDGPGEFQFPVGLRRTGDTLSIVDMVANRLTDIAPGGRVLRTRTVRARLSGFVAFLDSTTYIAAEPRSLRGLGEGIFDSPFIVRRVDLQRGTVDTLGSFGGRRELQSFTGDLVVQTAVPFTVHPRVHLREDRVYVLEGNTPQIDIYDGMGTLVRSVRVRRDPRSVTASDYTRYVDERIREISTLPSSSELAAHRAELRDIYDRMPRPAHFPFYDAFFVTDGDEIWVREYDPFPGPFQTWTRFDPNGYAVQIVRLPRALKVYEITNSIALGVSTDSMGVEYVERYEWSS
jgi:hypothetical protein